jgi:hypothetical protein
MQQCPLPGARTYADCSGIATDIKGWFGLSPSRLPPLGVVTHHRQK